MPVHPDCAAGGAVHGPHLLSGGKPGSEKRCDGLARLNVRDFPVKYRIEMILAYPVIAKMTLRELYKGGPEDRDVAFQRILDARNLRRTHELYLEAAAESCGCRWEPFGDGAHGYWVYCVRHIYEGGPTR